MKIKFSKMHGLGNDFMVIETITQAFDPVPSMIQRLADRHFGVGFDQLLLVGKPKSPTTDFSYRIFNGDGAEIEQCGNGARCFGRFVVEHRLSEKKSFKVETMKGVIVLCIESNDWVSVNMGEPQFAPGEVPFVADEEALTYEVEIGDQYYMLNIASMGNPHAVILCDDIEKAPVETVGSALQHHNQFPQRVNVGFLQVLSRNEIAVRIYERGIGETLACGTGACAAVVSGIRRGLLDKTVRVHARGGDMEISWTGIQSAVYLAGPAKTVYHAEIDLDALMAP